MTTRSKVTFAPSVNTNTKANLTRTSLAICLGLAFAQSNVALSADAALNKAIPNEAPSEESRAYKISSGPLGVALSLFASQSKVLLSFDPTVTDGKSSAGLNGNHNLNDGFKLLLKGSGLTVVSDQKGGYQLERLPVVKGEQNLPIDVELKQLEVRAKRFYELGPLPGLGLSKEEIPGNVQSITAKQIKDSNSLSMADLLNTQLQSVNVNDYQGNPFQMDVTYRGFTAGPQIGTPQGLSVFFDGIRVNEPFGDVVNWDMIPLNALAGVDVFPGSNPIFGLNTLGGAFSIKTKNGFEHAGVEANVLTGSFGRKQFLLSAGGNTGYLGGFVALNLFDENGWRKNSPSEVNQLFSKLSFRNDSLTVDGSVLYVSNNLVGNGLIPKEIYQQSPNSIFTSPDTTKNDLLQFQIASAFQVSDNFSITGQVYNRKSNRRSSTGDVNTDIAGKATRRARAGENPVCAYSSTNPYGIPDYYVVSEAFGDGSGAGFSAVALGLANGVYTNLAGAIAAGDVDVSTFNQTIPSIEFTAAGSSIEANMFHGKNGPSPGVNGDAEYVSQIENDYGNASVVYANFGAHTWAGFVGDGVMYYTDPNDATIVHFIVPKEPINGPCGADSINPSGDAILANDRQIQLVDANGDFIQRDGASANPFSNQSQTGYIEGTPTAVISETQIDQIVKGGAFQFNWNVDKHKFMVGSSIDHATSTYKNSQRLGLLDIDRNAYLDPNNIGEEYTVAGIPISNNDFNGGSDTRSLYFSETFSPQDNLHFSFAARYNYTKVMNNLAIRRNTLEADITDYQNRYMDYLLCSGLGLGDCDPSLLTNPNVNKQFTGSIEYLEPFHKESFTYNKINPSIGATWSPQENLNVYANWNQGTRTPSAIELGCAFDRTPVNTERDPNKPPIFVAASLLGKNACTLPNTLSGDPYLPQVVSRTFEVGARGNFNSHLQWNISAYRTNLTDDIYFISYDSVRSFFDTIGKTRRQGLEMGISGNAGKANFKLNYSLTDATFQSAGTLANTDNSSVNHIPGTPGYNLMTITSGNKIPGIPLHNLNASFGYQLTDKWRANLNMVAHAESFARGNENNQHRPGLQAYNVNIAGNPATLVKRYTNNGKTPGYAVLNFSTSYEIGSGWSATMLVNNILDKQYYSGSRLGINPFSPSINGVVGANGYNYNSNDWNSTSFVAPGAPRAAWFSLRYEFEPDKK